MELKFFIHRVGDHSVGEGDYDADIIIKDNLDSRSASEISEMKKWVAVLFEPLDVTENDVWTELEQAVDELHDIDYTISTLKDLILTSRGALRKQHKKTLDEADKERTKQCDRIANLRAIYCRGG